MSSAGLGRFRTVGAAPLLVEFRRSYVRTRARDAGGKPDTTIGGSSASRSSRRGRRLLPDGVAASWSLSLIRRSAATTAPLTVVSVAPPSGRTELSYRSGHPRWIVGQRRRVDRAFWGSPATAARVHLVLASDSRVGRSGAAAVVPVDHRPTERGRRSPTNRDQDHRRRRRQRRVGGPDRVDDPAGPDPVVRGGGAAQPRDTHGCGGGTTRTRVRRPPPELGAGGRPPARARTWVVAAVGSIRSFGVQSKASQPRPGPAC